MNNVCMFVWVFVGLFFWFVGYLLLLILFEVFGGFVDLMIVNFVEFVSCVDEWCVLWCLVWLLVLFVLFVVFVGVFFGFVFECIEFLGW